MAAHRRSAGQWLTGITLAASLLVSSSLPAFSAPVNSVNDGKDIVGGEYTNTAGNSTRFINSQGTGLHLHAGDTVVGREVDASGSLTGNGGSVHFDAPGQVVRLDGNVDVRGMDASGALIGKGGNVRVDAGFLYQNGQIWANGTDGGVVSFNVGSLTMGPNARIDATGSTGNGGVVDIKSPGTVDLRAGSVIDTSGKVVGTYNTSVIRIEGGLVNLEGILTANGKLPGQDGGLIDVKAVGNITPLDQGALNNATAAGIFTADEKDTLIARDALLRNGDANNGSAALDGGIRIASTSIISANGMNGADQNPGQKTDCGCTGGSQPTAGGNGGEIRLDACKDIHNDGVISVNGGNAGKFTADAQGSAKDVYGANGLNGGDAGKISFTYRGEMTAGPNSSIQAKGGNGADGQSAKTDSVHTAYGGKGGDGGKGGTVEFSAPVVTDAVKNTVDVKGGDGGKGGNQPSGCNACDADKKVPGDDGAPGDNGGIVLKPAPAPCPTCEEPPPPPVCTGGDCSPPPPPVTPPITPPRRTSLPDGRTLYPKEYPRLGETLPGRVGPLLNYNRSIFMARAPLPIVKKRPAKLFPARVLPPPPVVMKKPRPPQKRVMVRGHW